jgi:hypothetical protein
LILWALEAGAEVADLLATAGTVLAAQIVSLERGVACNDYRQTGALELCVCGLELCVCGKGLREHRRELV